MRTAEKRVRHNTKGILKMLFILNQGFDSFYFIFLIGFLFGMSFVKTVFHQRCNMLQVMLVPWQMMMKMSRKRYAE